MIKQPVVLVLGAGASQPYGFPLGAALVDQIHTEILEEDSTLIDRLRPHHPHEHSKEFARALREARPYSIDAFLELRREFRDVGVRAIADVLLRAENHRTLWGASPATDWYRYLFNSVLVLQSREYYSAQAKLLSIITFNFDRSFERALFLCLRSAFGTNDEEARALAKLISVHHVHGLLGEPDWLEPKAEDATRFGHTTGNIELVGEKAFRSIKIIGEDSRAADTEAMLGQAKYVYFLGFGFDERNLKKINVPASIRGNIGMTRFGMSRAEIDTISSRLLPPHTVAAFTDDDPTMDVASFLRQRAYALFD